MFPGAVGLPVWAKDKWPGSHLTEAWQSLLLVSSSLIEVEAETAAWNDVTPRECLSPSGHHHGGAGIAPGEAFPNFQEMDPQ